MTTATFLEKEIFVRFGIIKGLLHNSFAFFPGMAFAILRKNDAPSEVLIAYILVWSLAFALAEVSFLGIERYLRSHYKMWERYLHFVVWFFGGCIIAFALQ